MDKILNYNRSLDTQVTSLSLSSPNQKPPRIAVLPPTQTSRFFNRIGYNKRIDDGLQSAAVQDKFGSVGLHGLGGVGKSTVAIKYVEHKLENESLNAVFWVCGQKDIAMKQSFTDVARKLGLASAKSQAHDENLASVQDWLRNTGKFEKRN